MTATLSWSVTLSQVLYLQCRISFPKNCAHGKSAGWLERVTDLFIPARPVALLVSDIDINMPCAIGDGLLRHAAEVDCAQHRTIHRIDHRCMGSGVAENVDPLVEFVEQNGVRATLYVNGPDRFQRLRVPHYDGLAAGETVPGFGIHDDTIRRGIGDFAGRLKGIPD
jgi:hypothetical protein